MLQVPTTRMVPTVTITNLEDDVSMDFSTNVTSSKQHGSVYLGQGLEVNKQAKKQLRKEEAFQRRKVFLIN